MAGWEGPTRSSFRTIAVLTLIPVAAAALYIAWASFVWPFSANAQRVASVMPPTVGEKAASLLPEKLASLFPVTTSILKKVVSLLPDKSPLPKAAQSLPFSPPSGEKVAEGRMRGLANNQKARGHILLIIDDIGFESQRLEEAMSIDPNINFSVLANGPRSREFAHRLHDRGFEVLCHLPMEPMGDASPGRDAILTSMSDDEITQTVRSHLNAVPFARGVNNHMGSRATADRRVMTEVLGALPETMYFIDSRTGGRSVAAAVARSMNIRTAARHVFLDDEPHRNAVLQQLTLLAQLAEKHGTAVGIGHPHESTLRVLREEVPRLRREGFRFVRGSEAVN